MKYLVDSVSFDSNVQSLHLLGDEFFGGLNKVNWERFSSLIASIVILLHWVGEGVIMAEEDVPIELKFRIYDGTDIAHGTYPLSTSVASLKQQLITDWPQDKSVIPKSVSDIKLIHAGKFLENNKTLAESRVHFGDLPGGVTTMHVVVQPPITNKSTDKNPERPKFCSCSIL